VQHSDPSVLSLLALGEPIGDADLAHLTACAQCQADAAALARVVSAVRVELPDGPPVPPPARVWDRIAAETRVSVAPPADPLSLPDAAGPSAGAAPPDHAVRYLRRPRPAARETAGRVLAGSGRRWTSWVAAAALVLGAAAGSLVTRLASQGTPPSPTVVAKVQLAALPLAPSAGGRAMIVEAADGERLEVDVTRLALLDGQFYEVWLIDRSIKRMLPVGILRGAQGQFVIPAGLDLGEYPVVDISVQEPGNPAHSGRSVLRGVLTA
jgi:Anti-sigma-K factor rskA